MLVEISKISVNYNPRKFFDADEMEELKRSVASVGIIQPITVVQNGDGFTVVAGHRRLRAAQEIGLKSIPVHVIETDDSGAVALIENTVRADMSPAEECDAAFALMQKYKGDLTEVALLLGWTEGTLRRRLALKTASRAVLDALSERKIKLGHAELLATVPDHANQDKALEKIIANNLSVQQVREYLMRLAQKLDTAIFDKTECASCRFNTALQSTLFSETVSDDAFCTNGKCFAQKTEAALTAKAESLKDTYPLIRVVRAGEEAGYTKLRIDGDRGVGEQQANRCRGCANYGATVSGLPGTEGVVETGICFDLDCNSKMVAAYQDEIKARAMAASPVPASLHDQEDEEDDGCPLNCDAAAEDEADISSQTAATARPEVALTNAVKEYRRALWNRAAMFGLGRNQDAAQSVLAAIIMKHKSALQGREVAKVLGKYVETMGDASMIDQTDVGTIARAIQSEKDMDRKLLAAAAAYAVAQLDESDVRSILDFLGVDITEIWKIDGEYLALLTKAEIISVADELGISEKIAGWKKVSNGKKAELIQAIMESGIDFKGLLPSTLKY